MKDESEVEGARGRVRLAVDSGAEKAIFSTELGARSGILLRVIVRIGAVLRHQWALLE